MGIAHRDLHNWQILIHFKGFDDESDFNELRLKVKRKKLLTLTNPADFDIRIADFGRTKQV